MNCTCNPNWNLTWQQLLEKHPHPLLSRQYGEKEKTPPIADDRIKAIAIFECNEPVVDIWSQKNRRIQMLPSPQAPFLHPDCNSGLPSCSKMRKTVFECLEKMVTELDTLAPSFGYKAGQISIRVFEGLRNLKTQEELFTKKLKEIKSFNKKLTDEEAEQETCKWISPVKNNIPVHSTGAAVDIRLWDEYNKTFVDLGSFGAMWGKNDKAVTFSEDITPIQKQNRYFMLLAAAKADLTNYSFEYWHFSHGDRYAAYWNNTQAKYSSLN